MIQFIFQLFLGKCKKVCMGVHDEELEAGEICRPSVSKSY